MNETQSQLTDNERNYQLSMFNTYYVSISHSTTIHINIAFNYNISYINYIFDEFFILFHKFRLFVYFLWMLLIIFFIGRIQRSLLFEPLNQKLFVNLTVFNVVLFFYNLQQFPENQLTVCLSFKCNTTLFPLVFNISPHFPEHFQKQKEIGNKLKDGDYFGVTQHLKSRSK